MLTTFFWLLFISRMTSRYIPVTSLERPVPKMASMMTSQQEMASFACSPDPISLTSTGIREIMSRFFFADPSSLSLSPRKQTRTSPPVE